MADLPKIPAWGYALGAVGIGGAFYLYKRDKEKKALESSVSSESTVEPQPEIAGVTNPAEEFPYSIGGGTGGGGAGALGEAAESENQFRELFGTLSTQEKEQGLQEQEQSRQQSEQFQQALEAIRSSGASAAAAPVAVSAGSGGGAPETHTPGTTTAPTTPPKPQFQTIKKLITGPKGDKKQCDCHVYSNGKPTECQHVSNGACVW